MMAKRRENINKIKIKALHNTFRKVLESMLEK